MTRLEPHPALRPQATIPPNAAMQRIGQPAGVQGVVSMGGPKSRASYVADNVLSPVRAIRIDTAAVQLPEVSLGSGTDTCYCPIRVFRPNDEGFHVIGWDITLGSAATTGVFRTTPPFPGFGALWGDADRLGENAGLIICRSDFFPGIGKDIREGQWFAAPTVFPFTNLNSGVLSYPAPNPSVARARKFAPGAGHDETLRRWSQWLVRETPGAIRVNENAALCVLFAVDQATIAAQAAADTFFETDIVGEVTVMPMLDDSTMGRD